MASYNEPPAYTRGEGEEGVICFNCGDSITSKADKKCSSCGYAFVCPSCGTQAANQAKFCFECGNSLIPTYPKAAEKNPLVGKTVVVTKKPQPKKPQPKTRITISMGHTFDSDAPLSYSAMKNPPLELKERGISEYQWQDWMEGLKAAKRKAPCGGNCCLDSCCCILFFCFPFGLLQCLCMTQCPISNPDGHCIYSKFHRAHRTWLTLVNSELEPKGCYMKILSRKRGDTEYWVLVIALTKAETQKLKYEPVADHDQCPSGRGRFT